MNRLCMFKLCSLELWVLIGLRPNWNILCRVVIVAILVNCVRVVEGVVTPIME